MRTDVDADSDLDTGPWRVRGFEALYHLHVKITRVNRLHGKISAWTHNPVRVNGGFASMQTEGLHLCKQVFTVCWIKWTRCRCLDLMDVWTVIFTPGHPF
jgi:hypothetical protein